jgi:hypothetical protein
LKYRPFVIDIQERNSSRIYDKRMKHDFLLQNQQEVL